MEQKDKIWCRSCMEWHPINNDIPLNKQYSDHTWCGGSSEALRLKTYDDYKEEEYDRLVGLHGL